MKRCPDNQINASFIDISRIKWLFFFYCGRLSFAQLVPLQALKHQPIIGLHPVEQTAFRRDIKDNGYKSVFTNLWLERQRNSSWIRDEAKIHKRVNSFIDGSAFCQWAPKRVPSDSEKHLRVYTSSHVCHSHEWCVDTATGKTLKKRNAC